MTSAHAPLPPEHAAFAAIIDAQPAPVRQAFHYLLCLAVADRGALRLVATHAGADGETFTIPRPTIPLDVDDRIRATLRVILNQFGPS